jgi:hypothetical protein
MTVYRTVRANWSCTITSHAKCRYCAFAVENQSSHTEINQWFYKRINNKARMLRQDDRPSTFDLLGDMAEWLRDEEEYMSSYRILETCVMSLHGIKRTNIDCERNYDEELVMTPKCPPTSKNCCKARLISKRSAKTIPRF